MQSVAARTDDSSASLRSEAPPPRIDRSGLETLRAEARRASASSGRITADTDIDEIDQPAPKQNTARDRMSFLRSELEREPISKGAPESLAALRAEFRRIHVDNAEEPSNFSAGPSLPSMPFLRPSRIILLLVALIAGGAAAFLATSGQRPAAPAAIEQTAAPTPPPAPVVRVLVAARDIGLGQRLSAPYLTWQDWPENAIRAEYITDTATPEAMTNLAGSIARFEVFAGEPIRQDKLVTADQGYMSAVLTSGMRAVSVGVGAETASGGYVVPNDRVDVVLTRSTPVGLLSQTILFNARVLAIDTRLGELGPTDEEAAAAVDDPRTTIFKDRAIATLELDSNQAEALINATRSGDLSLVLRSMEDADELTVGKLSTADQAIRMSSPFWTQGNGVTLSAGAPQ